MLISEAGSNTALQHCAAALPMTPVPASPATGSLSKGFTLLELLVVITIIAAVSAGVTLAMRDGSQAALERDAQRLAVLLESARAQSRATGVVVRWQPTATGFVFNGIDPGVLPGNWLSESTRAVDNTAVLLGPEPMIGAQAIDLTDTSQNGTQSGRVQRPTVRVATDGFRPFTIQPLAAQAAPPS